MSMTLFSNNPVILMLLPDKILYQEIKLVNNQGGPSKAKIQDMVAIRHPSGGGSQETDEIASTVSSFPEEKYSFDDSSEASLQEKTTMIMLCDDGSLKIYVADELKTEFWLQPHIKSPSSNILQRYQHNSCRSAIWLNGILWNLLPSTILDYANSKCSSQMGKQSK